MYIVLDIFTLNNNISKIKISEKWTCKLLFLSNTLSGHERFGSTFLLVPYFLFHFSSRFYSDVFLTQHIILYTSPLNSIDLHSHSCYIIRWKEIYSKSKVGREYLFPKEYFQPKMLKRKRKMHFLKTIPVSFLVFMIRYRFSFMCMWLQPTLIIYFNML